MKTKVQWIITLLGFYSGMCTGQIKGTTPLFKTLFNDYNTLVKPRYNASHVINVTVSMTLHSLGGIEEKQQRLSITGWCDLYWIDEFLVWNQTEYGVDVITISVDKIWTPDIQIFNSDANFGSIEAAPSRGTVLYNGTVGWFPGSKFITYCKINIRHFPFDFQECSIDFGLWSSMMDGVTLEGHRPTIATWFEQNSEWEIVYFKYSGVVGSYILQYTILLKRRYTFQILTIILPIVILSLLTNLVFLLPVESGEKVSLSISILLSYTVLITLVANVLPSNSDNVCLLAVYIISLVFLSALSTSATVLVLHFHQQGERVKDPASTAAMRSLGYKKRAKHLNTVSFVACMLGTCLINAIFFGIIALEVGF